MIIHIKNKDTLIVEGFKFKCSVGKKVLERISLKGTFAHHQENLKLENYIGGQIECGFLKQNYFVKK